jgi:replicative DNA helicase
MSTADNVLRALHGLESNGPGKYLAYNPYNAPGQSHAKNLQLDITTPDGEYGFFTLHSAQGTEKRSGSLYDLAEIVGAVIERQSNAPHIVPKFRVYRDLAHYADAHGVPASAYEDAGWKQTIYMKRPALQYETQSGTRWRFLDAETPRFIHKGRNGQSYKSCWYGLRNLPALLASSGIPIVLCNGEPSVVAAQYHGVPALCITSSGEKAVPAHMLDMLADATVDAKLIVALDCDEKGRDMAAKLVHQLEGLGYEVRAVDLGLLEGEDLADFCKLHTKDSAAKLAALPAMEFRKAAPDSVIDGYVPEQRPLQSAAVMESNALIELNSTLGKLRADQRNGMAKDAKAAAIAKARALLEQLEQEDGQSLLISGEDVADKAIQLYAAAKARGGGLSGLPTGIPMLDRFTDGYQPGVNVIQGATGMGKSWFVASSCGHLIQRGYRGVAITTEMQPVSWLRRVASYISGLDNKTIKKGQLTTAQEKLYADTLIKAQSQVWFLNGVRPTPTSLRATVLDAQQKGDLHFVIVDSGSRLTGTGDNISQETAAIQNAIQELAQETGLPFIVTGQVRGRDIANRAMKMPTINDGHGGSSWEHNADVLIAIYNHTYYVKKFNVDADPEFPEGVIAIRVNKLRDDEDVSDQIIKAQFIGGRGIYQLDDRKTPPAYIARYDDGESA